MFNIGIFEIFILVVVALIVVGPKDLPALLRTAVGYVRKIRKISGEFQSGIKKIADDVEYETTAQQMNKAVEIDIDDPISKKAMQGDSSGNLAKSEPSKPSKPSSKKSPKKTPQKTIKKKTVKKTAKKAAKNV